MAQAEEIKQTLVLPSEREVVFTRWFDAPQKALWRAHTDPALILQWWGPREQKTTVDVMDVRVGGKWRYVEVSPDGTEHAFRGEYKEIKPIEKLVYTFEYEPMAGHIMLETVILEEANGGTLLTMHGLFDSVEDRDGMIASGMEGGQSESWDRLAELADALEAEIVIAREFAAPRSQVWKAFTEEKELAKWWGPKGLDMESARLDLRPGGSFHYGMRAASGTEMWGKFVYKEIVPEERLVFVSSFSDESGSVTRHSMAPDWPLEILNTYALEDLGDRTRLTLRGIPFNASPEEIQVFASNKPSMNQGFEGTFSKLDEFLARA